MLDRLHPHVYFFWIFFVVVLIHMEGLPCLGHTLLGWLGKGLGSLGVSLGRWGLGLAVVGIR